MAALSSTSVASVASVDIPEGTGEKIADIRKRLESKILVASIKADPYRLKHYVQFELIDLVKNKVTNLWDMTTEGDDKIDLIVFDILAPAFSVEFDIPPKCKFFKELQLEPGISIRIACTNIASSGFSKTKDFEKLQMVTHLGKLNDGRKVDHRESWDSYKSRYDGALTIDKSLRYHYIGRSPTVIVYKHSGPAAESASSTSTEEKRDDGIPFGDSEPLKIKSYLRGDICLFHPLVIPVIDLPPQPSDAPTSDVPSKVNPIGSVDKVASTTSQPTEAAMTSYLPSSTCSSSSTTPCGSMCSRIPAMPIDPLSHIAWPQ